LRLVEASGRGVPPVTSMIKSPVMPFDTANATKRPFYQVG
jgi:hypothetical protein